MEWRTDDYTWDARAAVAQRIPAAEAPKEAPGGTDTKKRRRRFKNADACQITGCTGTLEIAYHKKYHICADHFKVPCLSLDGVNKRFCQKCGHFQALEDFEGDKRTCKAALEAHNARRRKGSAARSTKERQAAGGSASGARSGSGATSGSATPSFLGGTVEGTHPLSAAATASPSANHYYADSRVAPAPPPQPPLQQHGSGSQQGPSAPEPPPQRDSAILLQPPEAGSGELSSQLPHANPLPLPAPVQPPAAQAAAAFPLPQMGLAPSRTPHPPSSAGCSSGSSALTPQQSPSVRPAPAGAAPTLPAGLPRHAGAPGSQALAPVKTEEQYRLIPPAHLPTIPPGHTSEESIADLLSCQGLHAMPLPLAAELDTFHHHEMMELAASLGMQIAPEAQQLDIRQQQQQQQAALQQQQQQQMALQQQLIQQQRQAAAMAAPVASGGYGAMDWVPNSSAGMAALPPPLPPPLPPLQMSNLAWVIAGVESLPLPGGPAAGAGAAAGGGGGALGKAAVGGFGVEPAPMPAAMAWPAGHAAPMVHTPYISPARLHRLSLKVFNCTPDMLAPGIRAEVEEVLSSCPHLMEAHVRPGCTHLTIDLMLGPQGSAAAVSLPAARLLAALCCPAALGAAAGHPALLQWQRQLAMAAGRGGGGAAATAMVATAPLAEPILLVRPACMAVPPPGRPWPLVQLQLYQQQQLLLPRSSSGGGDAGAVAPPKGCVVLCRQAGRHVPAEVWGDTAATAAAAAAAAPTEAAAPGGRAGVGRMPQDSDGGSDGEGGSSSDHSSRSSSTVLLPLCSSSVTSCDGDGDTGHLDTPDTSGPISGPPPAAPPPLQQQLPGAAASSAAAPAAAAAAEFWVRPVGLRPGSCELEVQLPLISGFAGGGGGAAAGNRSAAAAAAAGGGRPTGLARHSAVLLSTPAPLLVLRDAAAAAEVQALVQCSGHPAAQHLDDLLRDIGLAAAYLEEWRQQRQQQPARRGLEQQYPPAPLPPAVVAAAAQAAAHFAAQHSMPAVRAMLMQAVQLAAAAAAAAAVVPGAAAAGELAAAAAPPSPQAATADLAPPATPLADGGKQQQVAAAAAEAAAQSVAESSKQQQAAAVAAKEAALRGDDEKPVLHLQRLRRHALSKAGGSGPSPAARRPSMELGLKAIYRDMGILPASQPAAGAADSAAAAGAGARCTTGLDTEAISLLSLLRLCSGMLAFWAVMMMGRAVARAVL